MKGMILAAGYGTRLGDLTGSVPKAMVPVGGRPMIAWAIDRMVRAGCTELLINTHHFAELMRKHFETTGYGVPIRLLEEQEILGTGGGILNAAGYLEKERCFLLHNADIVSDCDLTSLVRTHRSAEVFISPTASSARKPFATLAVQKRRTSRAVLFDGEMRFLGKEIWLEESAAGDGMAGRETANADLASGGLASGGLAGVKEAFGFCGIHVISARIFELGYREGFSDIFEIYRSAMEGGEWIGGYRMDCYWSDLGTAARIRDFEQRIGAAPL